MLNIRYVKDKLITMFTIAGLDCVYSTIVNKLFVTFSLSRFPFGYLI